MVRVEAQIKAWRLHVVTHRPVPVGEETPVPPIGRRTASREHNDTVQIALVDLYRVISIFRSAVSHYGSHCAPLALITLGEIFVFCAFDAVMNGAVVHLQVPGAAVATIWKRSWLIEMLLVDRKAVCEIRVWLMQGCG
jgi:hypothetical protein